MDIHQVVKILKQSVELVYIQDASLIETNAHEQAITHRIAYYFENMLMLYPWYIQEGYNIDVEYNRYYDDPKRKNDQSLCKPDIILHRRGYNKLYDNLLVIEVKKNSDENLRDFDKLSEFTNQRGKYKYHLGIYINLKKDFNQVEYTYFSNGKKGWENNSSFVRLCS